jgi:glycosyltransferase involved in cell wall biosynthesis
MERDVTDLPHRNRISVVIPTRDRAALLEQSLRSLTPQSLSTDRFEVVVVDDGSTDDTGDVCAELSSQLPMQYVRIEPSGIAAAKNLGLFMSDGEIVLFFDDDDIAHPDLLVQHLQSHLEHPEMEVAVLGWTGWAPTLEITEVMRYVMDIGQMLFSYTYLEDGQLLDYRYFWGGRASCKKGFLARHGIFNQVLRFGYEDIELSYRLATHGLKVVHNRKAVSWMNRQVTYDGFCSRCERQGRSQFVFANRLHPGDPIIEEYCGTAGANDRWSVAKSTLQERIRRVHELEEKVNGHPMDARRESLVAELHELYRSTFHDHMLKGCFEASCED